MAHQCIKVLSVSGLKLKLWCVFNEAARWILFFLFPLKTWAKVEKPQKQKLDQCFSLQTSFPCVSILPSPPPPSLLSSLLPGSSSIVCHFLPFLGSPSCSFSTVGTAQRLLWLSCTNYNLGWYQPLFGPVLCMTGPLIYSIYRFYLDLHSVALWIRFQVSHRLWIYLLHCIYKET